MKYAVIDVGSNSVRLMLSENGVAKKEISTTRLAEGKKDDLLNLQSSLRTLKAIKIFVDKARSAGADKILIFATAAVRSAKNGAQFCEDVKKECGVEVDVLSGEREAKTGVFGALNGKDGGVIDIGGASTEIAVVKGGKFVYAKSLPLGAVTLTERFGGNCRAIRDFLCGAVKEYGDIPQTRFYAVGGTATTLAAISLETEVYDAEKVDGYILSDKDVLRLSDMLCALTVEERKRVKGLQKERADIMHAGALILRAVTDYADIRAVTVKDCDNLEGYLAYYTEKL